MEKYKKIIKKTFKKIQNISPTWNEELELTDGSYSVSDIQDYFKYFIQTHEAVKDNPPTKIEKRIKFRTKTEYYLEL